MNSFKLYIPIFILFFSTSYSQDFINDLYISNSNQNNNIVTDYFEDEQDYINEHYENHLNDSTYNDSYLDYESRINKFHNPHYQFYYTWDYGWGSPYWHRPYLNIGYHNYGWNSGLNYGLSWSWGNSWHDPYWNWNYGWGSPYHYSAWNHWGYNWHNQYSHHSPLYYHYNYNTDNYSYGHRNAKNTNIPSKANNTQRTYKNHLNSKQSLKERVNKKPPKTTNNINKSKNKRPIQKFVDHLIKDNKSNNSNSWKPTRNNKSNNHNNWNPTRNTRTSKSNKNSRRN